VACGVLLTPLAIAAANSETPGTPETPAADKAEAEAAEPATAETAGEDKRICRYVKLETASRRKTKVCRTTEEWRELNNIR
jgi:hypothetical protein